MSNMANFCSTVAHSLELDPDLAVIELIEKCEFQLATQQPQAGILFANIDADHQLIIDKILEKWPNLQLIGCTTDGEFSSEHGYQEDSLVLTLFSSDQMKIVAGCINNTAEHLDIECSEAFIDASDRLGLEAKLCILLSDVLKVNGEAVMEQLTLASKGKLPIAGGLSGDSCHFEESLQMYNRTVSSNISPFLLFSGPLNFSFGMDSGWKPIGELDTITKAEGNVIYEINHIPTLEYYNNILGGNAKPNNEMPIAIYDENSNYRYMRTSLENYDEETGAVTYLGNVPVNSKVCIATTSRLSILEGASSAIDNAIKSFPSNETPTLALCFSCSARRALLGTKTKEEYQIVQDKVGNDVQISGFYTYGELCPLANTQINGFHNETLVVLLLG